MSQRVKRQGSRIEDGSVPTKRRKGSRWVGGGADEEEGGASLGPDSWLKPDLKANSIYNRSTSEAPAELFRKDLISAMKLPDSEPLSSDEYWLISDQWKQEWERGVQVPVNPDSLPTPTVTVVTQADRSTHHSDFRLPKNKYIRITKDENFKSEEHWLSTMPLEAEKVCSYDLDNCDIAWLNIINGERAAMGYHLLREDQLERVIEELEVRTWEKVQSIIKEEEGLGIEFDENVICDVCRSPDCEEGNEMVFCDSCNICVHQACYGITTIPSGSWVCRTCSLGQRPECVLCPNRGGAMKATRSGHKWAHVSCALWIPEVSIGCVEKMEPITKISSIPQSRWALICVLCRERVGACIQCSVKTCKTAYHVTCAFKHGLEMRAIIEDDNADDGVKLRSYCEKHSVNTKKDKGSGSEDEDSKKKKRKDMTSEEKNQARAAKIEEIESEFDKHIVPSDVTISSHDVDQEGLLSIFNYWVLKRRSGGNRPLLAPRSDSEGLHRQREQADLDKMRLFVQLRQDLERVRNLCYMVSRREKLSRTLFRMREQTFHKQMAVLSEPKNSLSSAEILAIREANHGPSIYDRIYSHPSAPELSTDFETVLARIAGIPSPTPEEKIKDLNGMRKKSDNPYKRVYVNGGFERRRSIYASMSSGSDSEVKRSLRLGLDSTSGEDHKPPKLTASVTSKPKKVSKEKRLSKKRPSARAAVDTSTDEDSEKHKFWKTTRSKSLQQMEQELKAERTGTDDSDDLISFCHLKKKSQTVSNIYSDSETDSDDDSQNVRTKASMKEFHAANKKRKDTNKKSIKNISSVKRNMGSKQGKENKNLYTSEEEDIPVRNSKKSKDPPSDLIVPQRQAAKKATESIRGVHKPKEQPGPERDEPKPLAFEESKNKQKPLPKSRTTKSESSGGSGSSSKENKYVKEDKSSKHSSNDIYEFDKELSDPSDILAYVPQRQAAKKAAESIKSGNKTFPPSLPTADSESETSKAKSELKSKKEPEIRKTEEQDKPKKAPVKAVEAVPKGRKTPKTSVSTSSSSSSCSSSSSSESSSSSSSSSSDSEEVAKSPEVKAKLGAERKPQGPVLVKKVEQTKQVAQSTSSSSTSSDSDDSSSKRVISKKSAAPPPVAPTTKASSEEATARRSRKTPDKKLKTSDGRPELDFQQPPAQREESRRTEEESVSRKGRSSSSSKLLPEEQRRPAPPEPADPKECGRKRKSSEKDSEVRRGADRTSRSPLQARNQPSEEKGRTQHSTAAGRKNDKKVNVTLSPKKLESESLTSTLEREIAERKAGRDSSTSSSIQKSSSKKSLDRLFEKRDKLVKESEKKENILSVKSPSRTHNEESKKSSENSDNKRSAVQRSLFSPDYDREEDLAKPILTKEEKSPLREESSQPSLPVLSPVEATKPSDFQVVDPEILDQPKKISSRTSSLSAAYHPRSIFSPQPPSKDPTAELFDFGNDILAVDETVHTEGFIARDSEEMRGPPLSFSFSNEFLFKEDPKEDSARETLNLVEKLRLEYAKKSTQGDGAEGAGEALPDLPLVSEPAREEGREDSLDMMPGIKHSAQLDIGHKALDPDMVERTINMIKPIIENSSILAPADQRLLEQIQSEKSDEIPSGYEGPGNSEHYGYGPMPFSATVEVPGKVPGREKLDRCNSAQADERWVPPSVHSYDMHSPYRNKWAESELMPSRHSSSSSASSTSSSSQREEEQGKGQEELVSPIIPDLIPYPGLTFNPACALSNPPSHGPYSYSDGSYSVPLFPASSCAQISFPNSNMYPNFSNSYNAVLAAKSSQEETSIHLSASCSGGFSSSSHNLALTAAMVNPMPIMPEPPLEPLPFPPENTQMPPPESPATNSETFNHQPVTPVSEPPATPKPEKKSPSKPEALPRRMSARCIAQQQLQTKSPAKSPAKSPQVESGARGRGSSGGKRGRSGRGQRGRGAGPGARGRSRGRPSSHYHPDGSTIHSKLAGTVYDLDFEEDEEGPETLDSMSLRAMRERRKSSDYQKSIDSGSFLSPKDCSQSPKFTSPSHHKQRYTEAKPKSPAKIVSKSSESPRVEIVTPLLPGPVDMRTYSSYDSTTNSSSYRNHLMDPFISNTNAEQNYVDDYEEEMPSLATSKERATVEKKVPSPSFPTPEPKAVADDSRNQLKVKIKGPFLDANYSAAPAAPTVQPVLPPAAEAPIGTAAVSSFCSSGTSSLRRMRKKELLRQYWTQDMNMEESGLAAPAAPLQEAVVSRMITIPKAVASMTTIPTKEDYKAVVDANMEKKRKKEKGYGGSGEEGERRRELPVQPAKKGRGRGAKAGSQPPPTPTPVPPATKLKIKLGGADANPVTVAIPSDDRKNLRVRPPKKRLSNVPMPSLEEMKRESMKFRNMVMADFEEEEEPLKEGGGGGGGGKKRKKQKEGASVKVIENESAPKIIIRLGKRVEGESGGEEVGAPPHEERTSGSVAGTGVGSESGDRTFTPIRIKLSRCEEGYVTKSAVSSGGSAPACPLEDPDPGGGKLSSPLSLPKDCPVR